MNLGLLLNLPGGRAKTLAALAAIVLAACATPDRDLAAARESWRGASYDEVVAAWGAPATSAKDGAQETHTWVSMDQLARGAGSGVGIGIGVGSGRGVGVGVGVGGAIFGPAGEPVRCDRTLVFREGRVAEETWNGPADYCKRFARR